MACLPKRTFRNFMKRIQNRILRFLIVGVLISFGSVAAQVTKQPLPSATDRKAPKPEAVVQSLYKLHAKGYGPIFDKNGRKYLDRYFDANLSRLLWKNIVGPPNGEVGNLDFDPLFNAQDLKLSDLHIASIHMPKTSGNRVVAVTFKNYGHPNRILFYLHPVGSVWKIQDIDYGSGQCLAKILSQPF